VWVEGIIRALEFNLVIAPKVDRSWTFKGHGDTYHKTRIPNIEVQTKSASTALDAYVYTDTEETISINVHQACAIKHESIAQLLSRDDVKAEMQKKMGYSLGRSVDTNLASLAQNFSQNVGTLGVEVTYDNLLRAVQYLEDTGHDMTNDVCWFFSTAQRSGLMKMDTFIHRDYVGDEAAQAAHGRGAVAMFQGAPVIFSNLLRAPAAGQHENFLLQKETAALIMAQNPKTTTETIALDLADVVVQDQVYGYDEVQRYSETPGNITATDEGAVLIKGT
jgi:hypothetical protein